MEEFSRSRYRLESRYEHVLVDEFQDTSRAQWRLVRELVRAWSAGEGLNHGPIPPSIFIVGDRKQSIYGFRDAEVTRARCRVGIHQRAAARSAGARGDHPQLSIGARAAEFVNDICDGDREGAGSARRVPLLGDRRVSHRSTRTPTAAGRDRRRSPLIRDRAQAEAVADEIARLLIDRRDDSRSRHRRAAADRSRRHRRAVPHAREPQPVRGGPREARRAVSTSTRAWASSTPKK